MYALCNLCHCISSGRIMAKKFCTSWLFTIYFLSKPWSNLYLQLEWPKMVTPGINVASGSKFMQSWWPECRSTVEAAPERWRSKLCAESDGFLLARDPAVTKHMNSPHDFFWTYNRFFTPMGSVFHLIESFRPKFGSISQTMNHPLGHKL